MSIEGNRAAAIAMITGMEEHGGPNPALVTDDFRWWATATGELSVADVQGMIAAIRPALPKMPVFTITSTVAEGDRVAIEFRGDCMMANGGKYDNDYFALVFFRDGKISRINEYYDTKLASAAFGYLKKPAG